MVALIAAGFLTAGCGSDEVDMDDVRAQVEKAFGPGVAVHCPASVDSDPGSVFTCTVVRSEEQPFPLEIRVTDDHGGFAFYVDQLGSAGSRGPRSAP